MIWDGKEQVFHPRNTTEAKRAAKLWQQLPKERRTGKIYLWFGWRKVRNWR